MNPVNQVNDQQVNNLSSKMQRINLNGNGSSLKNNKFYDIKDTIDKIDLSELNDTLDELVESFITVNTYDEYDEYKLLVHSANCTYFDYNKEQTIYRYKRYMQFIKLSPELFSMIDTFLKFPKFELMKEIDNMILKIID